MFVAAVYRCAGGKTSVRNQQKKNNITYIYRVQIQSATTNSTESTHDERHTHD